jgi:hypothetical protein
MAGVSATIGAGVGTGFASTGTEVGLVDLTGVRFTGALAAGFAALVTGVLLTITSSAASLLHCTK